LQYGFSLLELYNGNRDGDFGKIIHRFCGPQSEQHYENGVETAFGTHSEVNKWTRYRVQNLRTQFNIIEVTHHNAVLNNNKWNVHGDRVYDGGGDKRATGIGWRDSETFFSRKNRAYRRVPISSPPRGLFFSSQTYRGKSYGFYQFFSERQTNWITSANYPCTAPPEE